jgi:hypothetical protein
MYDFTNGEITSAEKSKHVISLLYEVDRLGNTTKLSTIHYSLKRLFHKYIVLSTDTILCNFVQREKFLHTDHIYC